MSCKGIRKIKVFFLTIDIHFFQLKKIYTKYCQTEKEKLKFLICSMQKHIFEAHPKLFLQVNMFYCNTRKEFENVT